MKAHYRDIGIINIIRQQLKDIELQKWPSEINNNTRKNANQGNNIGTQSVQELFFLVIGSRSIRRTVHSNDLVKFFGGCDVQQEGNWKSIICKYNVTCTSVMVR